MKKVLALGVAALCALGFVGRVAATDVTGETHDVTAEYTIGASFTVTIPAGIVFTNSITSVTDTVSASNILLEADSTLVLSMKSANGNLVNGDSYVPYSFTIGETTTQIAKDTDYTLISVDSSNAADVTKEITFTTGSLDHVSASGRHADTLTFTVSSDGGTITPTPTPTPEEPETPPESDLLIANSDFIPGHHYVNGTYTNSYTDNTRTSTTLIAPQKIRVVLDDSGNALTDYVVEYIGYDAAGEALYINQFTSHKVDIVDGVAEIDLAAKVPAAANFRLDIVRFDGKNFLGFSNTATINVYKVTD